MFSEDKSGWGTHIIGLLEFTAHIEGISTIQEVTPFMKKSLSQFDSLSSIFV